MTSPSQPQRSAGERGFTVVELLVTLTVLVMVILGVLALFEMAAAVSRVQVDTAELQQSQRSGHYEVARMLRMAGRGGALVGQGLALPNGLALAVTNNVPADTFIDPDDAFEVLEGTDVLTIRGTFSSPVYTIVANSFNFNVATGQGSFQVADMVRPGVPIPQDLTHLSELFAPTDGSPQIAEALVLVSPADDSIYHIVELDPATSAGAGGNLLTIGFRSLPGDGARTAEYMALSGNSWDAPLLTGDTRPTTVGILEEYRYYVLDERQVPGDGNSTVKPRLARARAFPGTQVPHAGDAQNWAVPIVDGVADLQVALGIDRADEPWDTPANPPAQPQPINNPPLFPEEWSDDLLVRTPATDEWLFNDPADDPGDIEWARGDLQFLRITTTTVAPRRDREFRVTPAATRIEDHVYDIPEVGEAAPVSPDRAYRRRTLQTVVDLRNLS